MKCYYFEEAIFFINFFYIIYITKKRIDHEDGGMYFIKQQKIVKGREKDFEKICLLVYSAYVFNINWIIFK